MHQKFVRREILFTHKVFSVCRYVCTYISANLEMYLRKFIQLYLDDFVISHMMKIHHDYRDVVN